MHSGRQQSLPCPGCAIAQITGKGEISGWLGVNKHQERVKGVGLSCFCQKETSEEERPPTVLCYHTGDLGLAELGPAGVGHISVATGSGGVRLMGHQNPACQAL